MAIVYAYYGDAPDAAREIGSRADFPAGAYDRRSPVPLVDVVPDGGDARHDAFVAERQALRAAILARVPDAVERGILCADGRG